MDSIGHGYDWAWAQIPSSAVTSNGGSFVVRYLGGSARLTPQERDNHFAAGVKILLVFEQEAALAEGGYGRGVAAAQQANAEADALGYPSNCTLFYADDNNDTETASEIAFMRGVKSVGRRPSDMYSGGNVLVDLAANGLSEHGGWMVETWYPNAGANPCMIQLANTREPAMVGIDPSQYDTNLLLKPIPMWGASGTVGEDDMTPDQEQRLNEVWAILKGAPAFGQKDLDTLINARLDVTDAKVSTWLGQVQDHVDAQIAALPSQKVTVAGAPKLADIQKVVHAELQKLGIKVAP